MTLSVVITNFNTWPLTLRAVEAIVQYSVGYCLESIIIVDDASAHDVEIEHSLANLPQVHIHYNEANLGYVRSVNIGVKLSTADIILLLDSDAYLLSRYEEELIETFQNEPRLGATALRLVDEQGNPTGNTDAEPSMWSLLFGQKVFQILRSKELSNLGVIYSCGVAFRKEAFTMINGFDEQFDFLDADLDFSMNLRRNGWTLSVTNEVTAFHAGGGSPQLTSKRVVRFYVNRYLLLRKYQKIKYFSIFNCVLLGRIILEYTFLKVIGTWLYSDPAVRQDKLDGRRKLLNIIYKQII